VVRIRRGITFQHSGRNRIEISDPSAKAIEISFEILENAEIKRPQNLPPRPTVSSQVIWSDDRVRRRGLIDAAMLGIFV
jgi:hypothetical protein